VPTLLVGVVSVVVYEALRWQARRIRDHDALS
jgi:hypothetical protein